MKIKYKIAFKIRAFGRNVKKYQIRMRFSFNGQRTDVTTGWNLSDASAWNADMENVISGYIGPNNETASDINVDLQLKKSHMEMAFKYYESNDIIPKPSEVLKRYESRLAGIMPQKPEPEKRLKPRKENIYGVFDIFTVESGEKNAWTEATFEKMNALRVDLYTFNPNLAFSDITESILSAWVKYLRDDKQLKKPRKKKGERKEYDKEDLVGLKNSTIEKKLDYLRWFLKWAELKGYNVNAAYKTFRPTLKKTQKKVIFLTKEEIERVRNLQIPQNQAHLEQTRDVFLFCCFSGLRHSDVYNLRRNDIKEDSLEVTTIKTADSIVIELNKVTREIIDKYKEFSFPENKALPVVKNQPMNRDLKDLCRLAGINEKIRITTYKGNQRFDEVKEKWELVGTHTGRKTFIVSCLSLGIPPNIVMKWTGHSDYKSMQPYIDIVDSIKASEMTKLNKFF